MRQQLLSEPTFPESAASTNPPEVHSLLLSAFQGNAEALSQIILHYYEFVRSLALRHLSRYCDYSVFENSDDIAQNVMLKISPIVSNYQKYFSQIPFERFLSACVKHTVLDSIKRQARRNKLETPRPPENLDAITSDHHQTHAITQQRQQIRHALLEFQRRTPAPALLAFDYYYNGHDDSEIATDQHRTRNQIWRERQRALKALREYI